MAAFVALPCAVVGAVSWYPLRYVWGRLLQRCPFMTLTGVPAAGGLRPEHASDVGRSQRGPVANQNEGVSAGGTSAAYPVSTGGCDGAVCMRSSCDAVFAIKCTVML